jgi:hypothetical protein
MGKGEDASVHNMHRWDGGFGVAGGRRGGTFNLAEGFLVDAGSGGLFHGDWI